MTDPPAADNIREPRFKKIWTIRQRALWQRLTEDKLKSKCGRPHEPRSLTGAPCFRRGDMGRKMMGEAPFSDLICELSQT